MESWPKQIAQVWEPQPKQAIALECPADELFFGGAKGGGKSDFLLVDYTKGLHYGADYPGILFRRTYSELEELQTRAMQIYPKLGAKFTGTSVKKGSRLWTFPGGATLKMRYLDRDQDVQHYQGHQYAWIGFDELSEWPTDYCYIYMFSCARSAAGVPVAIRGSGNPGRPGHVWLKHRFIDNKQPESLYWDPDVEMYRTFIPAKLEDNIKLMRNDPGYEKRMKALPPHLYRAFRDGDWNVFMGQVFEELGERHYIHPIPIEPGWFRFASFDWGYARPYSIGWWTVTNEGRLIRYREMYGCEPGKHNVGVKKSSKDLARESWDISVAEGCKDMVADPSIWSKVDEGPSIADTFEAVGWQMEKADHDRVNGLAMVHDFLKSTASDGKPTMLIFNTCHAFKRTMPVLLVDDKNPEDLDTNGEDHVYDDTRYAVMSRFAKQQHIMETRYIPPPEHGGAEHDYLRSGLKE